MLHKAGYVRIFRPGHPLAAKDGYILEHRLVVYEAGIAIPLAHHVHHLNHDRADNRLENLVVMTREEHMQHHHEIGREVRNQYGISTVGTFDQQKARRRVRNARRYERTPTSTP